MNISDFNNYQSIEKIKKGFSHDEKFCVTTNDNEKFFLRISYISNEEIGLRVVETLKHVSEIGIKVDELVEYKIDEKLYTLHKWINGKDVEEVLDTFSKKQQYQYGVQAGKILKKIHTASISDIKVNWEEYFNKKVDSKIKWYTECGLKYENDKVILDYLNNNRGLLKNRPVTFQHGDYHVGNMMIENDELVIIDFNRLSYGDPWEEFNRIVWCVKKSHEFSTGMIDGYFENYVPTDFWKLLAFYICSNTISSLPWAVPYGEKQIEIMVDQAANMLLWYDNFQTIIPSWYLSDLKKYRIKGIY